AATRSAVDAQRTSEYAGSPSGASRPCRSVAFGAGVLGSSMSAPWLVSNIRILDELVEPCQGPPPRGAARARTTVSILPNSGRPAREGRPMLEALTEPRR